MTATAEQELRVTETVELRRIAQESLTRCGVELATNGGQTATASSPITGEPTFPHPVATPSDVVDTIDRAYEAFLAWRTTPGRLRGALVKRFGSCCRAQVRHRGSHHHRGREDPVRGAGRGQEMIDICDFAVGLSRQLEGRTMPSERPGHRLAETGIRSAWSASYQPSTSRPRSGRGTPRLRSCAEMPSSGSPPPKRR